MPERQLRPVVALGALLLLATSGIGGCKLFKKSGSQQEAMRFNEQLVAHNKSIHRQARELGLKIRKRLSGKGDVDDDELEDGVEAIKEKIKKVRAAVMRMDIPGHPTAVELHKAYVQFLKEEEALIERLEDVVEVVTTPDPRKRRKQRKLMAIIREISRDEAKSLRKLQKVQRRFARAHNITLKF